MSEMDEHPNVRRLLHLEGLSSADDPKLAERLDIFHRRSADDILDITDLVNQVVDFKNKEREKLRQQSRNAEMLPSYADPGMEKIRAFIEKSSPGASSVPKGAPRPRHIYQAAMADHDFNAYEKYPEETMVYIGLRVRIPFGLWDDPEGAKFKQDTFELHRIMAGSIGSEAKIDEEKGESDSGTTQQSSSGYPDSGEPSAQQSPADLFSKESTPKPTSESSHELQDLPLGIGANRPWSNLGGPGPPE